MKVPIKNIPTYDYQTKEWSKTSFETQEAFVDFLWTLFKDCGDYEFDESTKKDFIQIVLKEPNLEKIFGMKKNLNVD